MGGSTLGEFLVIKVGSTYPSLRSRKGDFEDWILAGMRFGEVQATIVDVRNGASLPAVDGVAGVVITGSHSAVTEHQDWSERTAAWVGQVVQEGTPLLGICYGHQLLAYALGGEVGDNPNGPEFGTVEVDLLGGARDDLLFCGWASPIMVHVSHTQSVLRLPAGAELLASSWLDRNQAFRAGDTAWGVQFHPEFDAHIVSEYLRQSRQPLTGIGQSADHQMAKEDLASARMESKVGPHILKRFAELILARGKS